MPATTHATLSGNVWKVLVAPGDVVDEDAPLLIIESTKTEIPVVARAAGVVVAVHVAEGDPVDVGQPLVDLSMD